MRSTQRASPIERLEPTLIGKLCTQANEMQVTSDSKRETQLDCCHNPIAQTKPKENDDCNSEDATSRARLINDLNTKITKAGASFAQQCLLNKGVEVHGQKGKDAPIIKEVDQLHCPHCFTPVSVANMAPIKWREAQVVLMFFWERSETELSKQE